MRKNFRAAKFVPPPHVLNGLIERANTLQEWLGLVAVEDGLLTHHELARILARELGLPFLNLRTNPPDPRALERIPAEMCRKHGVIPIDSDGPTLYVAMANPLDETAKTSLHTLAHGEIIVQVAQLPDIIEAINECYPRSSAASSLPSPAPVAQVIPGLSAYAEPPRELIGVNDRDPNSISLDELLLAMIAQRGSDLHVAVGSPPQARVDGELRPLPFPVMTPTSVQNMVYAVLSDVQITTFERHWELDFAYSLPGVSRFRVNVHRQRNSVGAVLRTIPHEIPTLEKLNMPPVVQELTERPRGLVLVTGPTGSGKSTTLAAMIDEINRSRRAHIVTIEDPIEFLHNNKMCVITQREVGTDTEGFTVALRHVLRQDPDVILIGEMRDQETIAAAVTAAETGHLVFATLHTTSAAQTIDRIIDVFPPHQQEQIRSQLSNVLEGILTQTLLPNIDGKGRSCAQEILIATPAIRNLIREGKVHQMPSVLQASAKYGMQTLDNALRELVRRRKVTLEEAILKSSNPEDFKAFFAMD